MSCFETVIIHQFSAFAYHFFFLSSFFPCLIVALSLILTHFS